MRSVAAGKKRDLTTIPGRMGSVGWIWKLGPEWWMIRKGSHEEFGRFEAAICKEDWWMIQYDVSLFIQLD